MNHLSLNITQSPQGSVDWRAIGDAYATGIRRESRLLSMAESGELTPSQVGQWLATVHHIITHTVPHLELAASVAAERGKHELEALMRKRADEERGHDEWSREGIGVIAEQEGADEEKLPSTSQAAKDLILFLEERIREAPEQHLVYAFLIEYMTITLGGEALMNMTQKCGIPMSALSVITNHVKLDVGHVEEDIEMLNRYLPQAGSSFDACRATIEGSFAHTLRAYDDCVCSSS